MDEELHRLISDYSATVAQRFAQLRRETGVASPTSSAEWACNGLKRGTLSDGATYIKHGIGCVIRFEDGAVDFDFGDHGEIDGFDAWRLGEFVRSSRGRHRSSDEKKIQKMLDQATAAGAVVRRGSLYYLSKKAPNQAPEPMPLKRHGSS